MQKKLRFCKMQTTRRGVEVSKEDKEEEEIDLFATSGDKKQNQEDEETEDKRLTVQHFQSADCPNNHSWVISIWIGR